MSHSLLNALATLHLDLGMHTTSCTHTTTQHRVQPRTLDAGSDEEPEQCVTFVDRDGELVEAMCCDYGWRSGAMRMYSEEDGRIPANFLELGIQNFKKEYRELRRSFRNNQYAEYAESMHLSDNPISRYVFVGGCARGGLCVSVCVYVNCHPPAVRPHVSASIIQVFWVAGWRGGACALCY